MKRKTNIKKKVSFILPAAYGTGGINVLYEYGRRLASYEDYEIIFYVPMLAYNLHRGSLMNDILKQIYATVKMNFLYIFMRKLSSIKKKEKVNIKLIPIVNDKYFSDSYAVFASAWVTAYDLDRLSIDDKKKWYFIQDYEVWDNEYLGKKSYQLNLNKIVIAKWISDRLVKDCNCVDSISIINNGIDTAMFSNNNKEYSSNGEEIYCLMLDHALSKKGVSIGIKALEIVKTVVPHIQLHMFGLKKSKHVPTWAVYHENPSKNELIELYRKSDIFIFPSLEEGWGLTPVEAMACKCAVAGSNVGCMLDIGVHKENTLLSSPGDVESLANNIIDLATNLELRKHIAENGCRTVQKLDWNESAKKFKSILDSINSK